jgi:hypothetical protein
MSTPLHGALSREWESCFEAKKISKISLAVKQAYSTVCFLDPLGTEGKAMDD